MRYAFYFLVALNLLFVAILYCFLPERIAVNFDQAGASREIFEKDVVLLLFAGMEVPFCLFIVVAPFFIRFPLGKNRMGKLFDSSPFSMFAAIFPFLANAFRCPEKMKRITDAMIEIVYAMGICSALFFAMGLWYIGAVNDTLPILCSRKIGEMTLIGSFGVFYIYSLVQFTFAIIVFLFGKIPDAPTETPTAAPLD